MRFFILLVLLLPISCAKNPIKGAKYDFPSNVKGSPILREMMSENSFKDFSLEGNKIRISLKNIVNHRAKIKVQTDKKEVLIKYYNFKETEELGFKIKGKPYILKFKDVKYNVIGSDYARIEIYGEASFLAKGEKGDAPNIEVEQEKISYLIRCVAQLEDANFIRNGKIYSSKNASSHLQKKWNFSKDEIKTVGMFIEHIASKSSISGKPYMIQLKSGKEIKTADFLKEKLKALNKK